jgi:hypothetical protein
MTLVAGARFETISRLPKDGLSCVSGLFRRPPADQQGVPLAAAVRALAP